MFSSSKMTPTTYIQFCLLLKLWVFSSKPGPGCSKQTMLLVNVSLKFQKLISEICHSFFLLKKYEKLL